MIASHTIATFLVFFKLCLSLPQSTLTQGYTQYSRRYCSTSYTAIPTEYVPTYSKLYTSATIVYRFGTEFTTTTLVTEAPTCTFTHTTNEYADVTTTIDVVTDTFYSTFSEWSTITEMNTRTQSEIVTKTILSTTTISTNIPTPALFRPISDTTNHKNYTGVNVENEIPPKIELRDIHQASSQAIKGGKDSSNLLASYPADVTCSYFITPYRTEFTGPVVPTTLSVTMPQTATTTVTQTITSTSTIAPRVSITFTTSRIIYTTKYITTTETSTSTSTTSLTASVSKNVYAACETPNILGPRIDNGQYIRWVTFKKRGIVGGAAGPTAEAAECCSRCHAKTDCEFSEVDSAGICWLYKKEGAPCYAGEILATLLLNSDSSRGSIFSNGPCGAIG